MNPNNLVHSDAVMEFFGYTNRCSFWKFVRTKGVPFIALNARRYMFDPVALNRWIEQHNTSPQARHFEFGAEATHAAPVAGSAGRR